MRNNRCLLVDHEITKSGILTLEHMVHTVTAVNCLCVSLYSTWITSPAVFSCLHRHIQLALGVGNKSTYPPPPPNRSIKVTEVHYLPHSQQFDTSPFPETIRRYLTFTLFLYEPLSTGLFFHLPLDLKLVSSLHLTPQPFNCTSDCYSTTTEHESSSVNHKCPLLHTHYRNAYHLAPTGRSPSVHRQEKPAS
jgi:hypothetical protein